MELIRPIGTFTRMLELRALILPLFDKLNAGAQFMLQTKGDDEWLEGTGRISTIQDQDETLYNQLHPHFHGTVIEDLVAAIPFPVYRGRAMRMNGRTCYSVHRDPTPRIHVPLRTSDQAWFVFPEASQTYHLKADGTIYFTDTTELHTFLNGSTEARTHLVFCTTLEVKDQLDAM